MLRLLFCVTTDVFIKNLHLSEQKQTISGFCSIFVKIKNALAKNLTKSPTNTMFFLYLFHNKKQNNLKNIFMRNLFSTTALLLLCVVAFVNTNKLFAFSLPHITISEVSYSLPAAIINPSIKEMGRLKNIEDSGYPFATLTIEFPERGFTEYFTLNLAEVTSFNFEMLSSWIGNYVSFNYESEITNALLDLTYNGKSVMDLNGFTLPSDSQKIEGIISNAEKETLGDVPDKLFITTKEEITETFPFFITPQIVALNGSKVIGYYQTRTNNTITDMEMIPK